MEHPYCLRCKRWGQVCLVLSFLCICAAGCATGDHLINQAQNLLPDNNNKGAWDAARRLYERAEKMYAEAGDKGGQGKVFISRLGAFSRTISPRATGTRPGGFTSGPRRCSQRPVTRVGRGRVFFGRPGVLSRTITPRATGARPGGSTSGPRRCMLRSVTRSSRGEVFIGRLGVLSRTITPRATEMRPGGSTSGQLS